MISPKILTRRFRHSTSLICLLIILVFIVQGCKIGIEYAIATNEEGFLEEEDEPKEASGLSEKHNKELYNKYFSDIRLGSVFFLGGNVNLEENRSTFLPHQKVCFNAGFKYKKNFIFRIAVLNLETNDFIERCAATISSEGSDGFGIEGTLLPIGKYEYRIYIENILVAILPFEVISYINYLKLEY